MQSSELIASEESDSFLLESRKNTGQPREEIEKAAHPRALQAEGRRGIKKKIMKGNTLLLVRESPLQILPHRLWARLTKMCQTLDLQLLRLCFIYWPMSTKWLTDMQSSAPVF